MAIVRSISSWDGGNDILVAGPDSDGDVAIAIPDGNGSGEGSMVFLNAEGIATLTAALADALSADPEVDSDMSLP